MSECQAALVAQLPVSIRRESEPVFAEPWQAQAFAMAVALLEAGEFGLNEWSATLGEEIAAAGDRGFAGDGSAYYELWLRALERLVAEKQLCQPEELASLKQAWKTAYQTTPHGQVVTIRA